jgi:hypothetical protein
LLSYFDTYNLPPDPSEASYYSNITGFIHGDVRFHNITPASISRSASKPPWSDRTELLMAGVNMTSVVDLIGTWNWSASHKLALSVVEKLPSQASEKTESKSIALVHVRSLVIRYLFKDI